MPINQTYFPFDFRHVHEGDAFQFVWNYQIGKALRKNTQHVIVVKQPQEVLYVKAETVMGALRILELEGWILMTVPPPPLSVGVGEPCVQLPATATVIE